MVDLYSDEFIRSCPNCDYEEEHSGTRSEVRATCHRCEHEWYFYPDEDAQSEYDERRIDEIRDSRFE